MRKVVRFLLVGCLVPHCCLSSFISSHNTRETRWVSTFAIRHQRESLYHDGPEHVDNNENNPSRRPTTSDDDDDGSVSTPRRAILTSLLASSSLMLFLNQYPALAEEDNTFQQVAEDAVILSRSPSTTASLSTTTTSTNSRSTTVLCDDSEARRIEIFERTAPGVVFIDTFTEQRDIFSTNVMEVPLGSGSGFVWDDQGHIVTNFHVVRNANAAQVAILTTKADDTSSSTQSENRKLVSAFQSKRDEELDTAIPKINPFTSSRGNPPLSNAKRKVYLAKVVGVDPTKDIAVLKVDAPRDELFPIALGTSTGLRVGQQSLAIGNPFGLDHTLTAGIISGIGREVKSPTGRPISNVIQTDAAINPGNSGGPLLDSQGRLIGMNTAIYSPSGASAGIGFAIPVDTVKYIVETLIRDGKVVRPILGISLLESKQAQALGINSGVLVLDVPRESPAYRAGMRGTRRTEAGLIELGDIITQVGDVTITTEADLFKAVETYKPGDRVKLTVVRVEPGDDQVNMKEVALTIQLIASTEFTFPEPNKLVYPGR